MLLELARSAFSAEKVRASAEGSICAFKWDYDSVGNRTYEKRGTDETYYEYDATNALTRLHELTGDEWTCFAYDERGNCTEIEECAGTTYFEYNDASLVISIKYKDSVMNYFWYDAQQRRYAIQDSDRLSYFAWDQNGMDLLCERDTSGNVTAEYTHGYMPIDGIGSMVSAKKVENGTTYYLYRFFDHRGTVHKLVDNNGNTLGEYEYDAWGQPLHDQESGVPNRFRYQSNWVTLKDSDGELCLTPTRLYHAEAGRFLQRDPFCEAKPRDPVWIGRTTECGKTYLYSRQIPSANVDPRGLWLEGTCPASTINSP